MFDNLASLLENTVAAATAAMKVSPLDVPVELGDFAIQRYPAGSTGIGIHRDGKRYRGLVFIITLAGIHACSHARHARVTVAGRSMTGRGGS